MPIRIPAARRSEVLTFGVGGIAVLAPLYMMMPGASERMASQTARWAPRWERNINFFVAPVERGTQLLTPPVERAVKHIGAKLPLEKAALNVDRRIRQGMHRAGWTAAN